MFQESVAAIVGPTAVGKSKIAVEVADRLAAEIISADAFQIYRGLDIGTAKITEDEKVAASGNYIQHHLIDIADPGEPFSVARYQELARATIAAVYSRGYLPLLVGGSGLYLRAAVDDYYFPAQATDPALRRHYRDVAASRGPQFLHDQLARLDPPTAARLHPHDIKRVIRALEIMKLTGKKPSELQTPRASLYRLAMIGLWLPRPQLYARIEERVDEMLRQGLVEEVRRLLDQGYTPQVTAFQGLGYKEIVAYLQGRTTLEEAIATIKLETRRYAKRQLTWFRHDPRVEWVDASRYGSLGEAADDIARRISRTLAARVE